MSAHCVVVREPGWRGRAAVVFVAALESLGIDKDARGANVGKETDLCDNTQRRERKRAQSWSSFSTTQGRGASAYVVHVGNDRLHHLIDKQLQDDRLEFDRKLRKPAALEDAPARNVRDLRHGYNEARPRRAHAFHFLMKLLQQVLLELWPKVLRMKHEIVRQVLLQNTMTTTMSA